MVAKRTNLVRSGKSISRYGNYSQFHREIYRGGDMDRMLNAENASKDVTWDILIQSYLYTYGFQYTRAPGEDGACELYVYDDTSSFMKIRGEYKNNVLTLETFFTNTYENEKKTFSYKDILYMTETLAKYTFKLCESAAFGDSE